MRSFSALVFIWLFLLAVTPALAEPASCDRILEMLSRGVDAAQVASELETTQARVSACTKVAESAERLAERRAELHWQRQLRGLD